MSVNETIKKEETDYKAMQLKVGLEVHQQLATKTKLFCGCPCFIEAEFSHDSDLLERFPIQFTRILRAATSELGEMDLAAKFEARRVIRVNYLSNKETSCLVEADEEPPHSVNNDALETSLVFALALKSRVIDEIHVMRKIVVDGSNTSGFQRTAVVALGGILEYNSGLSKVGVQSISVEEDAARSVKLEESPTGEKVYVLDRLGIPLVEVALAPIEGTPEEIENAAGSLGRFMRASGRIARGLGTIRQDLNVSVMNSHIIEVKGVQKLEQIGKVVRFEAARQKFFYDLSKEIEQAAGGNLKISLEDATDIFTNTKSNIIKSALSAHGSNARVACILVKDFAGFIGKENSFGSRLGKELGAIARAYGLGGVFHSDELPNYGVTAEEVKTLRDRFSPSEKDAFVLLAGNVEKVSVCSEALIQRLRDSLNGVPPETRATTPDGETVFLRPRPGAARMYPETDIPLIEVSEAYLRKLEDLIPEPWDKQVKKFAAKFKLSAQLAEQLFDSDRREVFEQIVVSTNLSPGFVAYSLIDTVQNLSREEVEVDNVSNDRLKELLIAIDKGKFAKEALPEILRILASNPETKLDEALARSGFESLDEANLAKIVRDVIGANIENVKSKGMASQSMIMGKVMQKVRGKVDGKIVNEAVSRELGIALHMKGTD